MNSRPAKPKRPRSPKNTVRRPAPACPIMGVGASAGGLEAFTQLLQHLPVDTGFGFVLVQHLDPLHESVLTQLLARTTAMPVHEATNNLRVMANHVYIIPPNTSMGIARGRLKLRPRARNGTAARSIDFFFEALAQDQQERAIGVILSGNASDGTLGLEAIKAEGGLTFAQDDSARYDSMPRSAIAAGCVDFVLPPMRIARELARIARHPYVAHATAARSKVPAGPPGVPAETNGRSEPDGYRKILLLLRNHSGVDFSLYKSSTIHRRMTRRAVLNHRATLESYAEFLRGNARELDALYSDSLISVTSFFRNADAFAVLHAKVLSKLAAERGEAALRIWVLGCSTGQEAYSIAMLCTEAAEKSHRPRQLQVFATDLSEANLEKARHGLYPKSATADVSPERLARFFVPEEGGYRVIKSLREQVVFARHNLISDPPFSRMDLITCRNVMIYFEPSLQRKAIPAFHYALKPAGFLFLGASDSVGGFTDLFALVDKRQKIFSKKAAPTAAFQLPVRDEAHRPGAPRVAAGRKPGGVTEAFRAELSAEREADRVTVNQFAPPGVLINEGLQILQFRGPTGLYLEPPTGKAQFDLLKMAREGLLLPLRKAISQAKKSRQTVRLENVLFSAEGRNRAVHLEIVPLKNLKEPRYLVLFEDPDRRGYPAPAEAPALPASQREKSRRIAGLEQELTETRDYLQSIQEQQESANEELQASNEEGQSANEELQSLNEELETSKEELESTNEELTTVNEEMVSRNTELNRLNNDLTNLQNSTKLVILLLGRDLTIRRFSAQAEKQFHLHASDLGRSIGGIRHNLEVPDLEALVTGVIASACEEEREVRSRDGHWYSLRVRPYLSAEHQVDGAVLVLVDIDAAKQAGHEVTQARDFAEAVIGTVRDPLLILDAGLRVHKANEAFLTAFKLPYAELADRTIFELDGGRWKSPRLRSLLRDILPRRTTFDNFEVIYQSKRLGRRIFLLNARMLSQDAGHREKILLGFQDITARKEIEEALQVSRARYRVLFELGPIGVYSCDAAGTVREFNRMAVKLWGREPKAGDPGERYCGAHKLFRPDGTSLPHDRCPMAAVLKGRLSQVRDTEAVIERPDGSRISIIVNIVPLKDTRGKITGAINCFYDVTGRKRTERELARVQAELTIHAGQLEQLVVRRTSELVRSNRSLHASVLTVGRGKAEIEQLYAESQVMQKKLRLLTHQILTTQEDERKKISRDLHDDVVQTLVGLNVELSALVQGPATGVPQLKRGITRSQRLVTQSVDSVHRFARELRPAVLDDLGLIPALHVYCKALATRKRLVIKLTAFAGVESMDSDKRTVLFRVAQEALTNVARHAHASLVQVNITRIPGAVRLEIGDNGKSFPVRKIFGAKGAKRLGLVGMRERVEMVGGTLTIESTAAQGTTVRAEIPFPSNPSKK